MKLTLFWSYYEKYISSIYASNPLLSSQSYKTQLEFILSDNFGWPPALAKRMSQHGYEVEIIITNAEPLQRAWARENTIPFDEKNWKYEIAFEQVKQFNPDVLWIGSMFNYFGEYLKRLKPYSRRIFAWIACPMPSSLDLSNIDCILTSHSNFQEHFIQLGKPSELLLPAFEEDILTNLENHDSDIDCSFVGQLSWAHLNRIDILSTLAKETPIQIWGDRPRLISRGLLQRNYLLAYLKIRKIRHRIQPSVWGMDMYRILQKSQIIVNVHGEVASGIAGNMRMFEATGVGALLITEDAPNIRSMYEPNQEIVTYTSKKDLIEKINYYVGNPCKREEIAQAGKLRTSQQHSTRKRSNELAEILRKYL
jgi:spore maturation protein CgeB